ncbi:MAG: HlyD family type I secretion periplasmic adaptor subunit [Gammaproteobacteria bacterium]
MSLGPESGKTVNLGTPGSRPAPASVAQLQTRQVAEQSPIVQAAVATPPAPANPAAANRVTQTDLDFAPDLSAAFLQKTPRTGRLILWSVLLLLAAALYWSHRAELDEVTSGMAKVVPSSEVQVVQNLEGGIVSELLVREGDEVEAGQVLLRIDDTRVTSTFRESRAKRLSLEARASRLRAEAFGGEFAPPPEAEKVFPQLVSQELGLLESRREELASNLAILGDQKRQIGFEMGELKAQEKRLARSLSLANRELKMTKPLVAQGAISEVEVLKLERDVNDLRGELAATRQGIKQTEAKSAEAERKVNEAKLSFTNEARETLNDTMAQLSELNESSTALEDQVSRTSVRSPVNGIIKQLLINTVGGVVQPGMDLVEIVPLDDTLLVEANIKPADIAFLWPGQKTMVKFTAYDFAIYGGLEGKLERISADTIWDEELQENFYQVLVRTDKNHLGPESSPLGLIPGMTAEVDVLTGHKTVLDYLLKPVLRARNKALTER